MLIYMIDSLCVGNRETIRSGYLLIVVDDKLSSLPLTAGL